MVTVNIESTGIYYLFRVRLLLKLSPKSKHFDKNGTFVNNSLQKNTNSLKTMLFNVTLHAEFIESIRFSLNTEQIDKIQDGGPF